MARPLRIAIPDGAYHVTTRGLERRRIVRTNVDRSRWVDLLDVVCRRYGWHVFAWALMKNHFHLFLRTPQADLSSGMHDLNAGYVSWFNRKHHRCGPLFQGRFKAVLVERDHHYWELTRYVHLNPVRAGVVARPEEFRWSSCRAYFDQRIAPEWLAWSEVLAGHHRSLARARRSYRAFLKQGLASPPESPLNDAVASVLIGSSSFIDEMRSLVTKQPVELEVPAARVLRDTPDVAAVEEVVSSVFQVPPESLRVSRRHGNDPRHAAVYLCRALSRTPVALLGRHFGDVRGQAISNITTLVEHRRATDRRFDRLLKRAENALRKM